jgi:hypothetical protein
MIALPIGIGLLAGLAYWRSRKKTGVLTPERELIYKSALDNEKNPENLRALAKSFREEGLDGEADMLEKRAALRNLPPDVAAARRDVYNQALQSENAEGVEKVAAAFEQQGATGAAATLKNYAAGLKAAGSQPAVKHGALGASISAAKQALGKVEAKLP